MGTNIDHYYEKLAIFSVFGNTKVVGAMTELYMETSVGRGQTDAIPTVSSAGI